MVAEQLAQAGLSVRVFEAKASAARKFLMAVKEGSTSRIQRSLRVLSPRYGSRAEVDALVATLGCRRIEGLGCKLGL